MLGFEFSSREVVVVGCGIGVSDKSQPCRPSISLLSPKHGHLVKFCPRFQATPTMRTRTDSPEVSYKPPFADVQVTKSRIRTRGGFIGPNSTTPAVSVSSHLPSHRRLFRRAKHLRHSQSEGLSFPACSNKRGWAAYCAFTRSARGLVVVGSTYI